MSQMLSRIRSQRWLQFVGRVDFVTITIAAVAAYIVMLPKPAGAYDDPGHFYTASAVLHHLRSSPFTEDERRLIAFCAWLPDETHELNALSVAWDAGSRSGPWFGWYLPKFRAVRS